MRIDGIGRNLALFYEAIHASGQHQDDLERLHGYLREVTGCIMEGSKDMNIAGSPFFANFTLHNRLLSHSAEMKLSSYNDYYRYSNATSANDQSI